MCNLGKYQALYGKPWRVMNGPAQAEEAETNGGEKPSG